MKIFPDLNQGKNLVKWLKNRKNWQKITKVLTVLFLKYLLEYDGLKNWWRPSPFRDVLTVLYEGRIASLSLNAKGESAGQLMWPVSPLLSLPVDPMANPEPEKLEWHNTQIFPVRNDTPWLQFQHTQANIEEPAGSDPNTCFLSDLAFIIDSSASMGYDPFAGTGEYDILLRTIFSVFHWLKKKRIASYLKYAVLNFSSNSFYSGWTDWSSRENLFSTLFNHQGGGTRLDLNLFNRLVREACRPFTAIMITDGELNNLGAVNEFILRNFIPPHGFVLVQIGKMRRTGSKLKTHGFRVHVIDNVDDLEGLVLGEIKQRYVV